MLYLFEEHLFHQFGPLAPALQFHAELAVDLNLSSILPLRFSKQRSLCSAPTQQERKLQRNQSTHIKTEQTNKTETSQQVEWRSSVNLPCVTGR